MSFASVTPVLGPAQNVPNIANINGQSSFSQNPYEFMSQSIDRQNQLALAGISADASRYNAKQSAQAQITAAQAAADASKFGVTQGLAYKQGIFNTVFPQMQSAIGSMGANPAGGALPSGYATNISQLGGGGGGAGGPGGGGGGAGAYSQFASSSNPLLSQIGNLAAHPIAAPGTPDAPTLPTYQLPQFQQASLLNPSDMPVISQDLLNQQMNAGRAQNQMAAATQIQQARSGVGGRGLGASSPLAQGLAAQIGAGAIAATSASNMAAQENAANLNAQYAQAMNQALINQASSVYGSMVSGTEGAHGADVGALQGMYGAQLGLLGSEYGTQGNMYNAQLGALQGMYGQQLGYAGQMGSADLARQAQIESSRNTANANIYGTNVGFQQAIDVAKMNQQNQILQSLAGFANA